MKKAKIIVSLCLSCILAIGISAPVFASEMANDEVNSSVQLYPGEVLIGDTIIGVETATSVNTPRMTRADCPNYATSKETLQLHYSGYIQFRPSYKTTATDGSGLVANRNVKQGWIDYRRDGSTVIGGAEYTTAATSKTDDSIYSASASCLDSLLIGDKYTTVFYRGWSYFA